MTEMKRVMVSFTDTDWKDLQDLKRQHFDLSYAEIVRMAFRAGKKKLEPDTRKDPQET
ncbi:MAG: hypothetical protein II008_09185 [Oscillospiraceae bacterium]|nr:hypothetical protein [Oscillospiraceae bacterium]